MTSVTLKCIVGIALGGATLCPHAAEPVKIGLNIPLSGPFAAVGELYAKNSQFIVDDINARGGVLGGRKLEIVAYDNKMSPQDAMLGLKRITDQHIPFIIATGGSHISVPLASAVEKHNNREPDNRILFLNEPGDQGLTQEDCSFWTFSFHPSPEAKMAALTTYIATQKSVKRVYLINQDYLFGQQISRFAREMLTSKRPDVDIVGDDLHPLGKVKDFAPYVAKIQAARADTVITGNWGTDMTLLIRAAASSGLSAAFYTYYAMGLGAPTAMGPAAIDKVKVIWRWHPNLPFEDERRAAEAYKQRYGLEYYSMPLNNLFAMLVAAIERAGSTDALAVAYELEDIRVRNSMGEAWMRPDDHQLFEPLYIMTITRINGRDVKFNLENTELGTRTEARIEAKDMLLPTRCLMKRPIRQ
jgi:branched-chain amino acid transport system substrate-binding protein